MDEQDDYIVEIEEQADQSEQTEQVEQTEPNLSSLMESCIAYREKIYPDNEIIDPELGIYNYESMFRGKASFGRRFEAEIHSCSSSDLIKFFWIDIKLSKSIKYLMDFVRELDWPTIIENNSDEMRLLRHRRYAARGDSVRFVYKLFKYIKFFCGQYEIDKLFMDVAADVLLKFRPELFDELQTSLVSDEVFDVAEATIRLPIPLLCFMNETGIGQPPGTAIKISVELMDFGNDMLEKSGIDVVSMIGVVQCQIRPELEMSYKLRKSSLKRTNLEIINLYCPKTPIFQMQFPGEQSIADIDSCRLVDTSSDDSYRIKFRAKLFFSHPMTTVMFEVEPNPYLVGLDTEFMLRRVRICAFSHHETDSLEISKEQSQHARAILQRARREELFNSFEGQAHEFNPTIEEEIGDDFRDLLSPMTFYDSGSVYHPISDEMYSIDFADGLENFTNAGTNATEAYESFYQEYSKAVRTYSETGELVAKKPIIKTSEGDIEIDSLYEIGTPSHQRRNRNNNNRIEADANDCRYRNDEDHVAGVTDQKILPNFSRANDLYMEIEIDVNNAKPFKFKDDDEKYIATVWYYGINVNGIYMGELMRVA